jgi:peroxiredoxin
MIASRLSSLKVLGFLLVSTLVSTSVAVALDVGAQAPDFILPSTTGESISLSQFRRKKLILLEFYGVDFAPTCAANLSARKAEYATFQELNVVILGISTNHPFSQKTFAESLQLPYPLLSNFPDMQVTRQYGGLSGNRTLATHGVAERAFFLIDMQGIVRQRWIIQGGEDVVFSSEPLLKAMREVAGK